MKRILSGVFILALTSLVAGCAGMSSTEQRVLSGGALGAASGAAIGAATGGSPGAGAAIGGAAGAVGGAILDQVEKSRRYDSDRHDYDYDRYPEYREHRYYERDYRDRDKAPDYRERQYYEERYYDRY